MSNPSPKTTPAVDPTPEEIRAACLAIQAEWTEEDRMRRLEAIPKKKPVGPLQPAGKRIGPPKHCAEASRRQPSPG